MKKPTLTHFILTCYS